MALHVGIDLGTSGIKAVLIEDLSRVIAVAAEPVAVSRPRIGHSEQDAELWVKTVLACLDRLAAEAPREMGAVRGIGLSGQMLAALILDADLRPLRPAILWNDQRALAECAELLAAVPDIGLRTNGTPDPGITAPKLMWLRKHEPALMDRARMLMLTKDYVRLALTGEVATEPSDAGGTQLLDVATGRWDPALCAAAGWDPAHLPPLTESWAEAGRLRPDLLARWGMTGPVSVAAGAGDNMGSTLGAGGVRPGDAVLTIGTSGVACIVDAAFHPGPQRAILTSAHVVPQVFLSMGVVLRRLPRLGGPDDRPQRARPRRRGLGFRRCRRPRRRSDLPAVPDRNPHPPEPPRHDRPHRRSASWRHPCNAGLRHDGGRGLPVRRLHRGPARGRGAARTLHRRRRRHAQPALAAAARDRPRPARRPDRRRRDGRPARRRAPCRRRCRSIGFDTA